MPQEKLIFISEFSEGSSEDQPEDGVMIKEAELFTSGVHRGMEFTEDDIETLATNFSADEGIPVQLDHSESAKDTVGYLKEVSSKGGKLLGKLAIIDEYAQKRIEKGLMKKLSVSFYSTQTEDGLRPAKLREVSLVAFPQVRSAQLFSETEYFPQAEEKEGDTEMADKQEQGLTIEQFNELKSQYDAMQKQVEKFSQEALEHKIVKFQEEKKVVPAQKDALSKLLSSFSSEQFDLFNEFMENASKVDFSEQGEVQQQDGEQKETQDDEDAEFEKFMEQYEKEHGKTL
ncbi:scaffolding protein [Bacillus phage 019DV002]|uniref:Scaffolding protein n=1 Tax=Bacillus phage 019DV002 TaxID=2601653 RepID=A0A5J6T402_9CAUD|nr:scaffolding protein [Bacillus phage 019DV002]QFG05243.1 scaffolding protein [Bacillus phage 019DV004]